MPTNKRRSGSRTAPSPPGKPSVMSLTISLPEIYDCLCPACREAFLALLEAKARGGMIRESLRRQLESPSPQAEGSNPRPEPVHG
jgi:hypothetical protein